MKVGLLWAYCDSISIDGQMFAIVYGVQAFNEIKFRSQSREICATCTEQKISSLMCDECTFQTS